MRSWRTRHPTAHAPVVDRRARDRIICVLCGHLRQKRSSRSASRIRVMPNVTDAPLSKLVREQMARPSPIRQIMKMAERQNILAMGLNPGRRDLVRRRLGQSSGAGTAAARLPRDGSRHRVVPQEWRIHRDARRSRMPAAARALRRAPVRRTSPRTRAHCDRRRQHAAHPRPFSHAARSWRHRAAHGSDVRQLRGTDCVCGSGRQNRQVAAARPDDVDVLAHVGSRPRHRRFPPRVRRAPAAHDRLRRAGQSDGPDPAALAGRGDARSCGRPGRVARDRFRLQVSILQRSAPRITPGRPPISHR